MIKLYYIIKDNIVAIRSKYLPLSVQIEKNIRSSIQLAWVKASKNVTNLYVDIEHSDLINPPEYGYYCQINNYELYDYVSYLYDDKKRKFDRCIMFYISSMRNKEKLPLNNVDLSTFYKLVEEDFSNKLGIEDQCEFKFEFNKVSLDRFEVLYFVPEGTKNYYNHPIKIFEKMNKFMPYCVLYNAITKKTRPLKLKIRYEAIQMIATANVIAPRIDAIYSHITTSIINAFNESNFKFPECVQKIILEYFLSNLLESPVLTLGKLPSSIQEKIMYYNDIGIKIFKDSIRKCIKEQENFFKETDQPGKLIYSYNRYKENDFNNNSDKLNNIEYCNDNQLIEKMSTPN